MLGSGCFLKWDLASHLKLTMHHELMGISKPEISTGHHNRLTAVSGHSNYKEVCMKYEYEAVSGDQSLFDLVDAYDFHCQVVKCKGGIYSTASNSLNDEVIAERKVSEVKLPVVGDECESLHDRFHDCIVAYTNDKYLTLEFADKSLISKSIKEFYFNYRVIDQSKRPNPVNMVEEKWVPKVGDKFRVRELNIVDWLCVEVDGLNIKAVECLSPNSIPTTIATSCYSFRKL